MAALEPPLVTRERAPRAAQVVTHRQTLPVELAGVPIRQVDATTCGSACLLMLAATGDPAVREWLEHGTTPPAPRPEIPPGSYLDTAARLAAAQRHIHRASAAPGRGVMPWPQSLGTSPWAAARLARYPGVTYRAHAVGRRTEPAALTMVANAVASGYPVLLYVGGTLAQGVARALPRHVVLAVPGPERVTAAGRRVISIFEPSSAQVFEVTLDELAGRTTGHPAFGNWTALQWLVYPSPERKS